MFNLMTGNHNYYDEMRAVTDMNRVSTDQSHIIILWAQVTTHRGHVFFSWLKCMFFSHMVLL